MEQKLEIIYDQNFNKEKLKSLEKKLKQFLPRIVYQWSYSKRLQKYNGNLR